MFNVMNLNLLCTVITRTEARSNGLIVIDFLLANTIVFSPSLA
jgi:hypothetical protein